FSYSYPPRTYLKIYYDIAKKVCDYYDSNYEAPLCIEKEEQVNGYNLYDVKSGITIMRRKDFDTFIKIWDENEDLDKEIFMEKYDSKACSDWSKIDENGECFEGYYKCKEGSFERENAWILTREKNGLALFNLPYPKKVLLK